jgi:hypothetical protein
MVQQTSLSSCEYPKGVDEFTTSGFTKEPSQLVKPPRVKESKIQMECKVLEVKPLGDGGGAGNLVICEVLMMHINQEILLNLGPAKGKDFCTVIGPMLVTPDELEEYKVPCKENHTGNAYNLAMKCMVNGIQVSEGNLADMDWTFAEIIERCAYGVQLFAGDVIGSGTAGTGCFLELNGTGKLNNPDYKEQWLKEGDVVEMEIDGLGKLSNTIVKDESDFSILALKKNV